ncbi:PTS transporter subunit EIIC [Clostridium sp. SYSU_GA19001]|uniref:PTS transporter subunit EIIC n=1 Tax=Clostridium caldaquaticum TaxID=2940653 RepID=UPI00207772BB|nr:PTS transporter subunit EIIC [Clostridium caldaquaticum]MCM8711899.1 PTS transporter subunit EIIC [Clostridium caldaquaticum]
MSKNEKFQKTAEDVLKAVGGKENVTLVTHCMTRLRFNLKDESIPDQDEIKKIPGVLGVMKAGGQLQIIIGQTVDQVFNCLCEIGGFENSSRINENLDKEEKKITFKSIGSSILDGLAGCLTPLIPLMMAASMFKLFAALLGPSMLKVISESNDLYKLFTFVGDAGFYFFPIVVGYTAAKKFGATPVIGMFLGAIMLHPTFVDMAAKGTYFTVYGIPAKAQNYSSTILPIIMSVFVMSYVEKFFKKYLPSTLKTILAPSLTILVMLPITLCILGPAGSFIGTYFCNALLGLSKASGFVGILVIAVIGALWEFLVMSGMHVVLISALILVFTSTGHEALVSPGAISASLAVSGMCLGAALRIKEKEQKSLSVGYLIAGFIGGVTEPGLYGIGMRYKRPFVGMMIGGFAGGLYAAIMGVSAYTMVPVASVLAVLGYAGGPFSNLIQGSISSVIAFVAATIATYFLGFKKDDPIVRKQ